MFLKGVGIDWGFGCYVRLKLCDEAKEGVLLAAHTPEALVESIKCAEAFEVDGETNLTKISITAFLPQIFRGPYNRDPRVF